MPSPHSFHLCAALSKRSNNLIHLNSERGLSGACFSFYLLPYSPVFQLGEGIIEKIKH